jgi:UMF1 family MFS transporter
MAIVFVLSPLLGAMTDRTRTRMPFLVGATVLCVLLTALLGRLGFFITAACFILANIAFQAGVQFYDALLPSVSTPKNRGFIGGLGVGIGYAGSFIAVGLGFFTDDTALRFTLIAAAFALFAVPCFVFVRERPNPKPGRINWEMISGSTRQTLRTLRDTRQFPGLLRFLIARIFYTDAINTVIAMMMLVVLNVAKAAGAGDAAAKSAGNFVMIFAISFAIIGGLTWGVLVDLIGSRKVLLIVLGLWCGVLLLAAAIGFGAWPVWTLYVLGPLAGIALGGTWAADRPYMLLLTPPERVGEFYGLYGMVGRFAAITGPALWAIITFGALHAGLPALTGQALALLALLLMIVVAAVIFMGSPRPTTH